MPIRRAVPTYVLTASAIRWPATCTGLRRPRRPSEPPAVVLCGPISSVQEQTLPHYAERLADAGYTALTFDPRTFGESAGRPRTTDGALLPEYAQQAYDAAQGRKELVWIETHNHIELYDQDPYVSEAARHAVRWLDEHLED
jgi:fermentation-respiration switch protein FrsA (DUF1100 family)